MAARFELGDPQRPRGHALLYFRNAAAPDQVLATYIVVLPIAINPAKYIPPAFAAQMQQQVSPVDHAALPPIPEPMGDVSVVRRIAEARGDDLLDGGVLEADTQRLMLATHEASEVYAQHYQRMVAALPAAPAGVEAAPAPDEDSVRWMVLNEKERIGELAKLTGQLRYAVDGDDERLIRATAAQVNRLKTLLPEKYRIDEFLLAAQRPGDTGRRLAELYIDRCYKLSNEAYEGLGQLDREIQALESSNA